METKITPVTPDRQPPSPRDVRRGIAWLLIAITGFGSLPVLIKGALAAGVNAETALSLRFSLAALVWWGILLLRRRTLWPGARQAAGALGAGALLYAPNALAFYYGTSRVPGSLAAMALAFVPVLVAVMAWLILKERLGPLGYVALALVVVGGVMLTGGETGRPDPVGIMWLGVAVFLYSLYVVVSTPVTRALTPPVAVTYVITGAAGAFWLWGILSGRLGFAFAPVGWANIVALAIIPTVVAMSTFLTGSEIVGATVAAIVNGLEPIVGVILAVLLLGDRPLPIQIAGGGLAILAAVLVQRKPRRDRVPLAG